MLAQRMLTSRTHVARFDRRIFRPILTSKSFCAVKAQHKQRVSRLSAIPDSVSRVNGVPFEDPKSFFSGARDLMVNGFDLLEELSEVTIDSAPKPAPVEDPSHVNAVSYFGSPGAYCEDAAREIYPNCILHPADSWGGTIEGKSDRAIVPIENHYTKRTRILYDLICKFDMHIVDEAFVNIRHSLLAKPGTQLKDVRIITSHIQGLFQCERFVIAEFPHVRLERMHDTAAAAQLVASSPGKEMAAIASASCADRYGLDVLKEGIQDRPDNVTRFVALGLYPQAPDPSTPSKTSILFALPKDKGSGSLGKALEIFAKETVNLLWLDSRELHSPIFQDAESPWHYLFYVNLEGSVMEERVKRALDQLQQICLFFRLIGSYKMKAKYLEDFIVPV